MTRREQFAAWMAESHGGLFELVRHFLSESLTSEMVSSREHLQAAVVGVLGAIFAAGVIILRLYASKYGFLSLQPSPALYVMAVRADRLFFICISMLVAGFATVSLWQSLFPGRADYLVLRPLPLRLRDIFVARFAATFLVMIVLMVDANLVLTMGFPPLSSGKWEPTPGSVYIAAHGIATVGAGLFVFFSLLALQGLLMNLLPSRWFGRVSLTVQVGLLVALIVMVPAIFAVPNAFREVAARPWWMSLLPPMWFLGVYESMLRTSDAYFVWLAGMALRASLAALLLAAAMYLLSYRRYGTRVLEGEAAARRGQSRLASAWKWISGSTTEEAVLGFTGITLNRSRQHKLLLCVYFGVGLALALDPALSVVTARRGAKWTVLQDQALLSISLVLILLVVSGLCKVFQIPAEPRANWIFRMAEPGRRRQLLAAVEKFILPVALVPALLTGIPAVGLLLGWQYAVWHAVFTIILGMLYVEMRLSGWQIVPFTCSYLPGRKPLFASAGLFWLLYTLTTLMFTGIEWGVMHSNIASLIVAGMLAYGYVRARRNRTEQWDDIPLLFDDIPEPVVRTLDLVR